MAAITGAVGRRGIVTRIAGVSRKDYEHIKNKLETDTESVAELLGTIRRRYMPDYAYNGTDDDLDLYTLHMAINSAIRIVRDAE